MVRGMAGVRGVRVAGRRVHRVAVRVHSHLRVAVRGMAAARARGGGMVRMHGSRHVVPWRCAGQVWLRGEHDGRRRGDRPGGDDGQLAVR